MTDRLCGYEKSGESLQKQILKIGSEKLIVEDFFSILLVVVVLLVDRPIIFFYKLQLILIFMLFALYHVQLFFLSTVK